MNETKIFRGLMLGRSGVLLVSIIIGSLLGGFAAAMMQNYHYQKEIFPQYQAKVTVQEKALEELTNKREADWTKQGLSKLQVAVLLRQQTEQTRPSFKAFSGQLQVAVLLRQQTEEKKYG